MDLWNGIIGVKGRVWLGSSNWSIPYYLDVGTGRLARHGRGRSASPTRSSRGAVKLVYRNLYFDQGSDKLIQDLRFSGPALGATFRF